MLKFFCFFFALFLLLPLAAQGVSSNIDINTAPLEDLVEIIHIGEERAKELISLRPFSSLDDLVRIKGIAEKRIEDIKKQGLAWVGSQVKLEPEPESEPKPISSIKGCTDPEAKNYNPKATTNDGSCTYPQPETEPEQKPEEEAPTEPTEVKPRPAESVSYPKGVIFNEVLPSPEGPDDQEEWIELYNQNNFEVDLSGWKIKDTDGKTVTYTFPNDKKIPAFGYFVLKRPETKITLNNSSDGLELIQPNGNVLDSIIFGKAPTGQSYNRISSDWIWSSDLTPGTKNITSSPQNKQGKQEPTPRPRLIKKQEANITLSSQDSDYPVILIALIVALLSTGTVLILKKHIDKN